MIVSTTVPFIIVEMKYAVTEACETFLEADWMVTKIELSSAVRPLMLIIPVV